MFNLSQVLAVVGILASSAPGYAEDIPACALTGSMTMSIGGKPALRLSDVVNCPPDAYEIISSIQIDGQPMVHFKPVLTGKTRCIALDNATVSAENKPVTALGDVHCETN